MSRVVGVRVSCDMDFTNDDIATLGDKLAALHDEHNGDDVTGFATPTIPRTFSFGFNSSANGDPNVLFDPNPPTNRFGTTAGGDPNV